MVHKLSITTVTALLFVLGCEASSTGTGTDERVPVWVDAMGKVADGVEGSPLGGTYYVDAAGREWALDPVTLKAGVIGGGAQVVYLSRDCSGPAYFISGSPDGDNLPEPRATFTAGDSTIRVRPDSLVPVSVNWCSAPLSGFSGECQTYACRQTDGIQAAQTAPSPPLTVPTLDYAPPLHMELR